MLSGLFVDLSRNGSSYRQRSEQQSWRAGRANRERTQLEPFTALGGKSRGRKRLDDLGVGARGLHPVSPFEIEGDLASESSNRAEVNDEYRERLEVSGVSKGTGVAWDETGFPCQGREVGFCERIISGKKNVHTPAANFRKRVDLGRHRVERLEDTCLWKRRLDVCGVGPTWGDDADRAALPHDRIGAIHDDLSVDVSCALERFNHCLCRYRKEDESGAGHGRRDARWRSLAEPYAVTGSLERRAQAFTHIARSKDCDGRHVVLLHDSKVGRTAAFDNPGAPRQGVLEVGQPGLDDLALFVLIARAGGVRLAARGANESRSLLSRRLAALEKRLGVQLVVRDTVRFSLTDAGRVLLDRAEAVVEAAAHAEAAARAASGKIRGRLRVACSPILAEIALDAVVCDYLASYPDVSIDLHIAAERIDLRESGMDIAFRTGPLPDSAGLRQRKLATSSVALMASPRYLKTRGAPAHVADLSTHDCIVVGKGTYWALADGRVPIRDRLRVNGYASAKRAALMGSGIARFSTAYARAELEAGLLQRILPEQAIETTVFAVMPGTGSLAPTVRAFLDLAAREVTTERLR